MQTIIREGRAFNEYTPQELEAARLNAEIETMLRTGNHKSSRGAIDARQFVPDLGTRKARRISTH